MDYKKIIKGAFTNYVGIVTKESKDESVISLITADGIFKFKKDEFVSASPLEIIHALISSSKLKKSYIQNDLLIQEFDLHLLIISKSGTRLVRKLDQKTIAEL